MDIKITKKRLANMLSYDWIKILLTIVAISILWSLLFTTTATRLTTGEQFYLVLFEDVKTRQNKGNEELLSKLKEEGILSYDVIDTTVSSITAAGNYPASYMLTLRLSTQEGDVILLGNGEATAEGTKGDESSSSETEISQAQVLVNGTNLYDIEKFLADAKEYCIGGGFIVEDGDTYTVNSSKIEQYFRETRAKSARNYRRTYNTEEKIQEGVKNEIARIENIYLNYKSVSKAIEKAKESGNDFLWYTNPKYEDYDGSVIEGDIGAYGIDLGKLNKGFEDSKARITDSWYLTDKNGDITSDGLLLCVFNFSRYQPDLQYESLAFIDYIIRTYSTYAD